MIIWRVGTVCLWDSSDVATLRTQFTIFSEEDFAAAVRQAQVGF